MEIIAYIHNAIAYESCTQAKPQYCQRFEQYASFKDSKDSTPNNSLRSNSLKSNYGYELIPIRSRFREVSL
jgi:hypothetical protein